jgi:hypothetical protein
VSIQRLILPPGKTDAFSAPGSDYFAIIFSPGTILIKVQGGDDGFTEFEQGDAYTMPKGQTFDRLEVTNPSITATVTVDIYAGTGRYYQNRQSVIEPDTVLLGQPIASLGPAAFVELNGDTIGSQIRRKSFQVSNNDANLSLVVLDEDGNECLTIRAGHSITLPVSKYVKILNPDGAATVACNISEIFWVV